MAEKQFFIFGLKAGHFSTVFLLDSKAFLDSRTCAGFAFSDSLSLYLFFLSPGLFFLILLSLSLLILSLSWVILPHLALSLSLSLSLSLLTSETEFFLLSFPIFYLNLPHCFKITLFLNHSFFLSLSLFLSFSLSLSLSLTFFLSFSLSLSLSLSLALSNTLEMKRHTHGLPNFLAAAAWPSSGREKL